MTATFADGSTASADILIGADGIRSTVRTLLDPDAPGPRYVGLLGLGAWVPGEGLPPTNGAMHFAFGRRAFFGYSIDAGHAGWFANLPSAEPLTAAEARRIPDEEWLRRLKVLYADDTLPALQMLDRVRPGELVNVGAMHDMPPVPVWHRGRAVLVGDAAHATSPSSGQGASLAIESAIELARCLRDQPVGAAFDAYERSRRPRVEKVIARTTPGQPGQGRRPGGARHPGPDLPHRHADVLPPGTDDGLDAPLHDRLGAAGGRGQCVSRRDSRPYAIAFSASTAAATTGCGPRIRRTGSVSDNAVPG